MDTMNTHTATATGTTNEDRFNALAYRIERAIEALDFRDSTPFELETVKAARNYVGMMDREGMRACFTDMEWLALEGLRAVVREWDRLPESRTP